MCPGTHPHSLRASLLLWIKPTPQAAQPGQVQGDRKAQPFYIKAAARFGQVGGPLGRNSAPPLLQPFASVFHFCVLFAAPKAPLKAGHENSFQQAPEVSRPDSSTHHTRSPEGHPTRALTLLAPEVPCFGSTGLLLVSSANRLVPQERTHLPGPVGPLCWERPSCLPLSFSLSHTPKKKKMCFSSSRLHSGLPTISISFRGPPSKRTLGGKAEAGPSLFPGLFTWLFGPQIQNRHIS